MTDHVVRVNKKLEFLNCLNKILKSQREGIKYYDFLHRFKLIQLFFNIYEFFTIIHVIDRLNLICIQSFKVLISLKMKPLKFINGFSK